MQHLIVQRIRRFVVAAAALHQARVAPGSLRCRRLTPISAPQATNPTKPNQIFKQETYREALTRLVAGGGVRDLRGVSRACGDREGEGDGDQGDGDRPGAYPAVLRVAAIAGGGALRLSHWSFGFLLPRICWEEEEEED
ncbi:hypothetical protein GW17_00038665 [Ensete ventricosum]|nr:hypothetical protein GW17_00038665 [Ensete ventricosum]